MKFIMFIVYSNIQGEKIKHLHFLLANVEELELVIGGILTYDYSKGSIDSYLSLLEDFKQKVLVVKDVGNLILLNSHPNKIEAYFSHPIDLGPVHSVYLDWVVYTENVVSAALKSNLTLMRKKIVEYTASVISLEAAES